MDYTDLGSNTTLVFYAGLSQLALAIASLAIPRVLGWSDELERNSEFLRALFWTYAGYVFGTNLALATLSTWKPEWLTDGSGLARAVCGFVALYWGVRLAIQVFSFGKHAPPGRFFVVAELVLSLLFLVWTALYGAIASGAL